MASTGSINFNGLSSGLDTDKIIEDLMTVESKPLKALETRKTDLTKKKDAFTSMKTDLLAVKTAVSELRNSSAFGVYSASSSDEEALTLSASSSAQEGTYRIRINSLAQAEALSGNSYTQTGSPLGITGEILINGTSFRIRSSNTLQDIANGINSLDNGVNAAILKVSNSDYRLVLSAKSQGKEGFSIANAGSADTLGTLGFTDGTKVVRETSNGAVLSSSFTSATSTIGSLSGISSTAQGTVQIRNKNVAIDLATDTLSTVRDKINALKLNGVSASVESSTSDGATTYRLSITGTQDFTDSGNVLESMGILEGGTSGVKAKFTSASLVTSDLKGSLSESTKLSSIGSASKNGDTESVTISGLKADGTSVSRTFQVEKNSTIGDLLDTINEAFNGSVTATLENGRIVVESTSAGESKLSVQLKANNERGGTLDFGTLTLSTPGRLRKLAEGQDAEILVNNTTVTRNSNNFSDTIQGLSLNLKKADSTNEVVVTVIRDTSALKAKIESLIKSYNSVVDFVEKNSAYDKETDTTGPLNGESTSRSVLQRLRDTLQQSFSVDGYDYTRLFQVGIEFDSSGRLKINSSKLDDVLKNNVDALSRLFTVTRTSSESDIDFSYSSVKTKPGTYTVNVTTAAEQASVRSDTLANGATSSGTLTVTDNLGASLSINVEKGDTATDIANRLNAEAATTKEEILLSSVALTSKNGAAVANTTAIADIAGVTIADGDTITITGTNHSGKSYQRRITLTGTDGATIQDVLSAIESMNDRNASASIDADGSIRVQDKETGSSKLAVSISTTVKGLDFGSFSSIQKGRNTVSVEASASGNVLTLNHTGYGTANTFTVSGGSAAGIADGTYKGVDVAGTINGVTASGSGQILTASSSDASTQGIAVRVITTKDDLVAEGGTLSGTITLVSGAADSLYREISSLTDTVGGLLQTKIDSYTRSLKTMTSNISDMNKRLSAKKQALVRKYAALEKALSRLQSIQQQMSSSLSSLSS